MSVGSKIKLLRQKKGWSQLYLAEKTGINNSVISRIESGKRPVEDHELKLFADIFNVSSDWLLGRTNDPVTTSQQESEINTAFYNLDGLTEEEKNYLDMQLEIFRKLKKEQKKEK